MTKSNKSEGSTGMIMGGLAMMANFGFLTWLQIGRISEESYWIIFRVWFIPVPIILVTAAGAEGSEAPRGRGDRLPHVESGCLVKCCAG